MGVSIYVRGFPSLGCLYMRHPILLGPYLVPLILVLIQEASYSLGSIFGAPDFRAYT